MNNQQSINQQAKQQKPKSPNTGRSSGCPIAVVVYLIRPNRGLAAVLLGKSTTTKASPRGGISKRIQEI
jgi:hypothetical protein